MEEDAIVQRLEIVGVSDGLINVQFGSVEDRAKSFSVMPPITMFEKMRDCTIQTEDLELTIEGAALKGGYESSVFRFYGDNRVKCKDLTYGAKRSDVSGSLWLDARSVVVTVANPEIRARDDSTYGWSGAIQHSDPWKRLTRTTLGDPFRLSPIARFLSDCRSNIPANGIVLMGDYSIPVDDPALVWAKRYGVAFQSIMKMLVDDGFAERSLLGTRRRDNKFRVRVKGVSWEQLEAAQKGSMDRENGVSDLLNRMAGLLRSRD